MDTNRKKVYLCSENPLSYKKFLQEKGYTLTQRIEDCDEFWLMQDVITKKMSQDILAAYKHKKKVINMNSQYKAA